MSAEPPGSTRQNSQGPANRPRLRPTKPATLVVAALAAGAIGWLIIANDYSSFPTVTWLPALILPASAFCSSSRRSTPSREWTASPARRRSSR